MIISQKKGLVNSKPIAVGALLAVITCSIVAAPAYAHHPMGAQVSRNFLEGFLSGLGHPIIGLDHLLFAIATGLLAATVARGYWIPIAFVLAALLGTGLHLLGLDLPILEIAIAVSVLGVGILLAMTRKPRIDVMAILAAIAGLFHGYAYGEAIIGATRVPLFAYLLGFTLIQLAIALAAYQVAQIVQKSFDPASSLRLAGCTILGAGMVFLTNSF